MAKTDRESSKRFAFPAQRKEPLENASHVRNAIARFDQVQGVSDSERDAAWERIRTAAQRYGIELQESSWRRLGADGAGKRAKKWQAARPARERTKTREVGRQDATRQTGLGFVWPRLIESCRTTVLAACDSERTEGAGASTVRLMCGYARFA